MQVLARSLVRGAGDTGKLSDKDISGFLYRAGVAGYKDKFKLWLQNETTPGFEDDVRKIVEGITVFYKKELLRTGASFAKRISSIKGSPVSAGEILEAILDNDEIDLGQSSGRVSTPGLAPGSVQQQAGPDGLPPPPEGYIYEE